MKNRKRFLSATRFEWSSILIKNPLNTITDEFWPERGKLFHFLHESGYDIWKFHLYHLYARNIFHRSILLHWVIKKKEKRINYTGNLDERKISLNVPINRWKYRIFESRIDSGIFGLDKKKVENVWIGK